MVRGLAKAVVCGNLTRDPEMRTTQSGTSVCSFGMAVNRVRKDASGNNIEEVSFFDIVAWGKLGETIAQYLKKGDPALISGRLSQRSWEDKNGGKRSTVEIVVEDFNFIGSGNGAGSYSGSNSGSASSKSSAKKSANQEPEFVPDDVPEEGEVNLNDIPF